MVTANQDESLLYCVAENSLFRNGSIIDLWQLEVHCKSICVFAGLFGLLADLSTGLVGRCLFGIVFVGLFCSGSARICARMM